MVMVVMKVIAFSRKIGLKSGKESQFFEGVGVVNIMGGETG